MESQSQQMQMPIHDNLQSQSSKIAASVARKVRKNLRFKSKWGEVNGAMGDLGTYIPIVLALTLVTHLNMGTTLIFTGVYNIITGAIYGVPMPVQPMKSIAAAAISNASDEEFGIPEIMAAGICTGVILFILGVTGLMHLVYTLIPLSVVRGIQLSQGLSFAITAVKYIRKLQNFSTSKIGGNRHWLGLDGLILAIVCCCFIIVVNGAGEEIELELESDNQIDDNNSNSEGKKRKKRVMKFITSLPSAFMVFLLGVILACIRGVNLREITIGPSSIELVKISKKAWKEGFIKGTIPQLPLSILNSVIAVRKLSCDLFPGEEFTVTSISVTVGMMNIVGCWFGAMPCCHGAGGLAGQYKFGGRSGGCVAVLGVAKVVLGLVLGSSLVVVLRQFPVGILGVLLLFAGIELSLSSRDINTKEEAFVMLISTAVSLMGSSAALGFLCGIVVHLILKFRNWTKS
ncbi:molybdate transporter 1 [Euphorbia lathyris]|uniref:molybdate transporter 1 n=1 Tax=Euphorbia lathyris TaxID=212925 RepID=UPI0033140820